MKSKSFVESNIFEGSSGSIAKTACTGDARIRFTNKITTTTTVTTTTTPDPFSPGSKGDLGNAVINCLKLSPVGDCSEGAQGPIGTWFVYFVTDMDEMFGDKVAFNGDISEWDVSRVTEMSRMFFNAKAFNANIFDWDVAKVTDMRSMFTGAETFNADISKWVVVKYPCTHSFAYACIHSFAYACTHSFACMYPP